MLLASSVRTTLDIDPILLKRLREEARRRGVSLKEALAAAVRRGLDAPVARRSARYRYPTFAMGTPRESLNLDKALALAAGLEDEQTASELAQRKSTARRSSISTC